jgi:hypothetical protein
LAAGKEAIKWGIGAIIVGISSYIIDAYLFHRGTAWPLTNSFFLASLFYSIFIRYMDPADPSSRMVLRISVPVISGGSMLLMLLLSRSLAGSRNFWFCFFGLSMVMLPCFIGLLTYIIREIRMGKAAITISLRTINLMMITLDAILLITVALFLSLFLFSIGKAEMGYMPILAIPVAMLVAVSLLYYILRGMGYTWNSKKG